MSHQQLIIDLKTSRESAIKALNEIYSKLIKCKDNTKAKSSVSYNAVHAMCMAIKDKGHFYDIYAEAIEKLVPDIQEAHWNMFVELLRFILAEFYSKNLFERSINLAFLVTADHIVTPADVKSHLKLFSRQLYNTHMHLPPEQLKELFKNIARVVVKSKEIQFEDLIEDFHTNILGFPSMLQTILVKHLDKASILFEKFFSAIASLKIASNKINDSLILLMKYLIHFIYLDVTDKNSVFSQNFLRACKDNQSFKAHKYQSYSLNLFYYFIKLMLFPNSHDFNKNFAEIIDKFTVFFERSELSNDPWFMDSIVTIARVLDAFKGQKVLLESMDEDSHRQLYSLIEKLIKLAHGVNYESGLWTCCNSTRKHIIFKLCILQLTLFETAAEKGFNRPELSRAVMTILKHTIVVAECFNCTTLNYEVALIMNSLSRCAQQTKTKEHGELLAKMLLIPTKLSKHLPENSVRTILKCLMHVHKISGNTEGQAEACALYLAHLMESQNIDTELVKKYIHAFYGFEPCMSVCETLAESTFPLKPSSFSRRLLHSIETGVYHKTRANNILVITSLLKSATNCLDFVLVARLFPQVSVIKKLERKYAELKSNSSRQLSPLEHLALGHICKFRAVQQMDDLKNLYQIPKVNDESLNQISDLGKLKQIDVVAEMQIMNLAHEGIEEFEKFFECSSQKSLSEEGFSVDWVAIIDDVAMLARLFHFRGYIDFAYKAWRFLLRITTYVNDILNRIRALGFLCDECLFIELYDPDFDIEQEIINTEGAIYECLMNLEYLTPRRQNYVLICLCNIGWFLATKGRFRESQILLDMTLGKIEELAERKNKFELVRATHLATSFRIKWKLQKEISKKKAFAQVDRILDEIRAVVYYTSEDSVNFPTLLFSVVNDISEFTTNRLSEPATLPYVQMVLKLALDTGAAFRIVQFLILWTHINLQSENASKCQTKLDLIDLLYRNPRPSNPELHINSITSVKKTFDINPADTRLIYEGESVRKAVEINPISPVRIKHKPPAIHRDLVSFLISHGSSCSCEKCSHTFLSWQFFKIGCLNARLLYLGDVYNEPKVFYAKAIKWCANKLHKKHTKFHFREYEFSMLIHYINLLRRTKNFNEAIETSECSIEAYNKLRNTLDGAYRVNLSVQLESTRTEMNRKPDTPKSPKIRRFLKFSPIESQSSSTEVICSSSSSSSASSLTTTKRRGRAKKESPQTIKENIENIIYKDPEVKKSSSQASRARSARRKEKQSADTEAVDDICKIVENIQISDEVMPKKPPSSRRRGGNQNLNTAIIIIDDDDSPVPSAAKSTIPKSVSKIECTPRTRGRTKKTQPQQPQSATVSKSGDAESRSKLLRRRI
ncbi:protein three rows [Eupeodes corollae]|uniref:protein three rows n=1 Tax=Eupeodes corollae TaxID=290404 RepID=UPI00248FAC31|nr:protein three rows [Eupeodes corollae]